MLVIVSKSEIVRSEQIYQYACSPLRAGLELPGVFFLLQTSHPNNLESSRLMHVKHCHPRIAESEMEDLWFRLATGECTSDWGNA